MILNWCKAYQYMKSISVLSMVNRQEQESFCFQGCIRSGRHSDMLWEFSVQMLLLPEEVQICTAYLSGKFFTFIFDFIIRKGICLFFNTASWLSCNVTLSFFSFSVSSVWALLINGNMCFQKQWNNIIKWAWKTYIYLW